MATVFRISRWVDTSTGKRVAAPTKGTDGHRVIPPGVARQISRYWFFKIGHGRRRKGYTDRRATEEKANRMERALARGEVGLLDSFAEHKKRPLLEYIANYVADMEAQGRDAMHVYTTQKRLTKLATACNWNRITDINSQSFSIWRQKADIQQLSPKTRNEYLQALQAFCRWAVRQGTIGLSPVDSVMPVKINGDIRRERRALSDSEVSRLLAVAGERTALYLVALTCGLRRSELASLLWSDVRLAAPQPYLDIRASTTKNGKRAILWLRDDVIAALKALPDHTETDHVFPMIGKDFCERWFYRDLAAAGIPRLDTRGRRADFHALRHTLATNLGRGGVSIRTAMDVMRHSDPRLTTKTYTDAAALPTAEALDHLPRYDLPTAVSSLKNGTFDSLDPATTVATTMATTTCTLACPDMRDVSQADVGKTRMDIDESHAYAHTCTTIQKARKTGGLGFEPRQTDSESAVLPLHHPPKDRR